MPDADASSVPAVMVTLPFTDFVLLSVIVLPVLLITTLPVNDVGHSLPVLILLFTPKLV